MRFALRWTKRGAVSFLLLLLAHRGLEALSCHLELVRFDLYIAYFFGRAQRRTPGARYYRRPLRHHPVATFLLDGYRLVHRRRPCCWSYIAIIAAARSADYEVGAI